jgi:alpha-ketoglutarate-dependent taurine dioxygenase
MTTVELTLEPATGLVGAWVYGVALDEKDTAVAETLQRKLHEHGVLFFQFEDFLSAEKFKNFALLFGEVEDAYGMRMKEKGETPFIDSDTAPMKEVRINFFHTDDRTRFRYDRSPAPNRPNPRTFTAVRILGQ